MQRNTKVRAELTCFVFICLYAALYSMYCAIDLIMHLLIIFFGGPTAGGLDLKSNKRAALNVPNDFKSSSSTNIAFGRETFTDLGGNTRNTAKV